MPAYLLSDSIEALQMITFDVVNDVMQMRSSRCHGCMSVQLVSRMAMVVILTLSVLPVAIQPRILQPDFWLICIADLLQ